MGVAAVAAAVAKDHVGKNVGNDDVGVDGRQQWH
jgi:hypothetical protein